MIELFECEGYQNTWISERGCRARQELCLKCLKEWRKNRGAKDTLLDAVDVAVCAMCPRATLLGMEDIPMDEARADLEDLCLRCGERPRLPRKSKGQLSYLCEECEGLKDLIWKPGMCTCCFVRPSYGKKALCRECNSKYQKRRYQKIGRISELSFFHQYVYNSHQLRKVAAQNASHRRNF